MIADDVLPFDGKAFAAGFGCGTNACEVSACGGGSVLLVAGCCIGVAVCSLSESELDELEDESDPVKIGVACDGSLTAFAVGIWVS